jgi:L-threonylcarbamoyladenylate synthase
MSIISNCTESVINNAAASLIEGNLVAFPTETVYGLGADATNKDAVARIYEVKGRPIGHPLIVHISAIEHLDKWAVDIPEYAVKLARNFWPGPMTLILPRTNLAKDFITGGQDSVGIRIPSHTGALALLKEFESQGGSGVAAPSANRFGAVSPTTADAVEIELGNYLGKKDLILDGGQSQIGIESTIIDCTGDFPVILRPGAITLEMVEKLLGIDLVEFDSLPLGVRVSGSFKTHYAPNAHVVLNGEISAGDGFIALDDIPTPEKTIRLASPKNEIEFAHQLYEALRLADNLELKVISIIPPTGSDLAVAIRDRLEKAKGEEIC